MTGGNFGTDYEKQIADRDEKIASLEAQVAEAAKNAETAEQLRGEIAKLKAQGVSDRIDFKLQLAGVRNVKAAPCLVLVVDDRRASRVVADNLLRQHVLVFFWPALGRGNDEPVVRVNAHDVIPRHHA